MELARERFINQLRFNGWHFTYTRQAEDPTGLPLNGRDTLTYSISSWNELDIDPDPLNQFGNSDYSLDSFVRIHFVESRKFILEQVTDNSGYVLWTKP